MGAGIGSKAPASGPSAAGLYWAILAVLAVAATSIIADADYEALPAVLAVFLPAIQLVASAVAAVVIGLRGRRGGKPAPWRSLGKITLWALAGAVAGLVAMLLIAKAFG